MSGDDYEACDVCGRTILRGERPTEYVDSEGVAISVCVLCKSRAEASGWRPAAIAATMPPSSARRRRGSIALRERLAALRQAPARDPAEAIDPAEHAPQRPDAPAPSPPPPPSPLEVFNSSAEPRKIAALWKSLGEPRVTVRDARRGGDVITAAWDLSWYRWIVRGETVKQVARGNEISELPVEDRAWNGVAAEDGTLSLG